MKKVFVAFMALALVLGMTQCKKDDVSKEETRTITLKLIDDGSKLLVNPETGAVGFTMGDQIYVAYNGHYAGTLTHNGMDFTGDITTSGASGNKLSFYFLGNKTPLNNLTTNTTGIAVSIFDQTNGYPVISCGVSNENYTSGNDNYTSTLYNQCALVKFDVYTNYATIAPTIITGVNDLVDFEFSSGTFGNIFFEKERGAVKLPGGTGERWAILLPQDAVQTKGKAYAADLSYKGTVDPIPAIVGNAHLTDGIEVSMYTRNEYSVSATQKVQFSPGNLQYIASTYPPYWKFADNQWNYFGATTGQNSAFQNVDRDLFGWGTSGWNNGNVYYQPWNTGSTNNSSNGNGYGPTDGTSYYYSLTGNYANADWGVYNSPYIVNGFGKSWRTWSSDEFYYLLAQRTTTSNIRYAKGVIDDYYDDDVYARGLIVLPDDWNETNYPLNGYNDESADYPNYIDLATWTSKLEANGAVFLPAAGERNGTSYYYDNVVGEYWTCDVYYDGAVSMCFTESSWHFEEVYRHYGFSVRLIRDIQ